VKTKIYHLFIHGKPAAQPRTRKGKYGNIYNPDTADAWKETIQATILAEGREDTILGPVDLRTDFFFYTPENSHKEGPHIIKPDIDNLVKAVMDALKGINIYKDDCQVYIKNAKKYWTNEKENEGMMLRVLEVL